MSMILYTSGGIGGIKVLFLAIKFSIKKARYYRERL